ncbi:MAG: ATPase P [Desulfobacter sp.]|nr:MAG: ATPase P [Desulfobacter sp.]
MIRFTIPGSGELAIRHMLFDYNGTLAVDGNPVPGIREKINAHSRDLDFHVITADTFGTVEQALQGVDCRVVTIPEADQDKAKADYLETLGPGATIACGNGANDELMLKKAALGVAVCLDEGMNTRALLASDLVIKDIMDLFGYLENPGRLVACLRK